MQQKQRLRAKQSRKTAATTEKRGAARASGGIYALRIRTSTQKWFLKRLKLPWF